MGMKRHGEWVYRDRRWKTVRLAAKRRDGFACVKCASRFRLEVDHIQPVRERAELAFDLNNLQTLCGSCHGAKTRIEAGHPELSPERQKWRDLLENTQGNLSSNGEHHA